MLFTYFITVLVILGLLAGWIGVQQLARTFAQRHPEFGPHREEGGSCMFCLCRNKDSCKRNALKRADAAKISH